LPGRSDLSFIPDTFNLKRETELAKVTINQEKPVSHKAYKSAFHPAGKSQVSAPHKKTDLPQQVRFHYSASKLV
jgi:hypothetical protein